MAASGVIIGTKEAVARLRERYGLPCVQASVRAWCEEGLLKHGVIGGRIAILDSDLDDFVEGLVDRAGKRIERLHAEEASETSEGTSAGAA